MVKKLGKGTYGKMFRKYLISFEKLRLILEDKYSWQGGDGEKLK